MTFPHLLLAQKTPLPAYLSPSLLSASELSIWIILQRFFSLKSFSSPSKYNDFFALISTNRSCICVSLHPCSIMTQCPYFYLSLVLCHMQPGRILFNSFSSLHIQHCTLISSTCHSYTPSVVPSFLPAWPQLRTLYLNTVPTLSSFFLPPSSLSAAQQYLTLTESPLYPVQYFPPPFALYIKVKATPTHANVCTYCPIPSATRH
jgi:hypothetical protein